MTREKLLNIVTIALQDCRTVKSEGLGDYFTRNDILDFANTIVAYLPASYDARFGQVSLDVIDLIADKESFLKQLLKRYVKELQVALLKEEEELSPILHHIIFLSAILLREADYNIDDVLTHGINYYNSLLLPSDDLAKNVHEIPSMGAVSEFDNQGNYLRINYNIMEFVPTLSTKQNFNYLIPKLWK